MDRTMSILALATAFLVLGAHGAGAQQEGEIETIKAANRSFYDAASARDLAQMDAVWAHAPYVRAIHPTSERIDAGWEVVRDGFQALFEQFAEISVSMPDPAVRVGETVAWITGEELFKGRQPSGEEVVATLLGTNVYERSAGKWLMVHHHVSVAQPPQQ